MITLSGANPFDCENSYFDRRLLFNDRFRNAFATHYHRETSGKIFDVWVCNH